MAAVVLCAASALALKVPALAATLPEMSPAQSDYVEQCGGCHGIQGSSAPAAVPVLKDRVGYFLCTPEGRSYLLHLPNVAHSRIADNDQLAELMNFVVFDLGRASAPAGTPPFTGAEVAAARLHALESTELSKARLAVVNGLIRRCGAPASLRLFYPGAAG